MSTWRCLRSRGTVGGEPETGTNEDHDNEFVGLRRKQGEENIILCIIRQKYSKEKVK